MKELERLAGEIFKTKKINIKQKAVLTRYAIKSFQLDKLGLKLMLAKYGIDQEAVPYKALKAKHKISTSLIRYKINVIKCEIAREWHTIKNYYLAYTKISKYDLIQLENILDKLFF